MQFLLAKQSADPKRPTVAMFTWSYGPTFVAPAREEGTKGTPIQYGGYAICGIPSRAPRPCSGAVIIPCEECACPIRSWSLDEGPSQGIRRPKTMLVQGLLLSFQPPDIGARRILTQFVARNTISQPPEKRSQPSTRNDWSPPSPASGLRSRDRFCKVATIPRCPPSEAHATE
jgi:hypothetical protein